MNKQERTNLLRRLAEKYETGEFLNGDPSWFMHQVEGRENQEVMAFLASVLSFGKRELFLPKIHLMLSKSGGQTADWVKNGIYRHDIADNNICYYRFYSKHMMLEFLDALRDIIISYGSIGVFAQKYARRHTALEVLEAFGDYFRERGIKGMVPSPHSSVAKRPCMFMRWMVRDSSPVDLGLWSNFIDKRTLYIPLDTHVMQEASHLGLISGKTASWKTVLKLTEALKEVFPDDPAKGDFALFGYGVDR